MPVLVSFWGKGGVGKTTISSAFALRLAQKGFRVYLISTDFVPSLSDVLDVDLSDGPKEVSRGLIVEQLTEEKIVELWKERFGEEVYRVASSIFPVDREIIDYVARAPGIVEEFTLYYVWHRFSTMNVDVVVWDTMATGGGIRMLRIEKEFYDHLGEAAKLYLKVKGVLDKIRRGESEPLVLIESWRRLAEDVFSFLRSKEHRAVLVSRPLRIDLNVARKIYAELKDTGIPLKALIVNMVSNQNKDILLSFEEEFKSKLGLITIPQRDSSPLGLDALSQLFSPEVWNMLQELVLFS
ncbi:hypothetical protein MA03_00630 [Infirmifilum uzonense]|uniref:ArsA/GET3 Anion-transporting ATPase-like domain-containing protein n=1 Tax=Infirmifilum uzonense TaxID=1550241 RepID=A0A0F7FH95_9CREN|nr:ArsA-related P-loop ATPase [Infirmifilum uzonense]AKG38094.1 hypothetical protein MA03_00630 [Infirmifilum uzonense]